MTELAEVDPEFRAAAAIDQITHDRRQWERSHKRPPTLTGREVAAVLQFECLLICTACMNVHNGIDLTDEDRQRMLLAMSRVNAICDEALR